MNPYISIVVIAAALAQGCDTLPVTKEQSKPTNGADRTLPKTAPASEVPGRKASKPVRPTDIAPGQSKETIKALQDELDAAAQ